MFNPLQLLEKSFRHIVAVVSGVLVLGTLVSLAVYRYTSHAEEARIVAEFNRRADVRGALTREIFEYYKSGVFALKCLFEGSDSVSREEFHQVASEISNRYPGITALEWVPAVGNNDRVAFEQSVSAELGRPFHFSELGANGMMARARDRAEHFPILYVEPLRGNERALGLDVQSAPTIRYLLEARSTRDFVMSGQFELVQESVGMVMIWPVFAAAQRQTDQWVFRGFVQGVFRSHEVFAQTQLRSPTASLDMLYLDETAENPKQRVLYYSADGRDHSKPPSETEFRAGLHREYTIKIGGRLWRGVYRPSKAWLAEQRTPYPQLWLGAGLLITVLLASLLSAMARRTSAITKEVAERTAELSENRRQLASLLDALPGMAYSCACDDGMTARYFSDGALALTGYRPDEFLGGHVHFRELIHPDDIERVRLLTRAALDTRSALEVEYRIRPRTGPEKWILSRGRSIDTGANGWMFEGLAIDITARKQAEADKIAIERKLLESQKLESLGLLAGGIAHDFNNLLTGIMGHANLARFLPDNSPEVAEHLEKIETGAARAAELCQQMLAYSGRGHFIVEPVDLNVLVGDTIALLKGSLPARARLTLSLMTEPALVMGDATQLRQIAMNLIMNASDALGAAGGEIRVASGRRYLDRDFFAGARVGEDLEPGEYVILEVSDTGCGMTRETITKIFDPFFTTKFTGRGLGLAAVLGIVRGHVGALRVDSAVGEGTTFSLALPLSAEKLLPKTADVPEGWRSAGRVLLIDDEAPVREVGAELIRTFGFTVVTAADGTEGIKLFEQEPASFTLVFLDLTMPGLDGVETLARLRAINPEVRVLLASGYSESDRVAQLAKDGPVLFMQKPFTRARLEEKLRAMLG